jgi:hypothetical protein
LPLPALPWREMLNADITAVHIILPAMAGIMPVGMGRIIKAGITEMQEVITDMEFIKGAADVEKTSRVNHLQQNNSSLIYAVKFITAFISLLHD